MQLSLEVSRSLRLLHLGMLQPFGWHYGAQPLVSLERCRQSASFVARVHMLPPTAYERKY
jgi:hypothetical protein